VLPEQRRKGLTALEKGAGFLGVKGEDVGRQARAFLFSGRKRREEADTPLKWRPVGAGGKITWFQG